MDYQRIKLMWEDGMLARGEATALLWDTDYHIDDIAHDFPDYVASEVSDYRARKAAGEEFIYIKFGLFHDDIVARAKTGSPAALVMLHGDDLKAIATQYDIDPDPVIRKMIEQKINGISSAFTLKTIDNLFDDMMLARAPITINSDMVKREMAIYWLDKERPKNFWPKIKWAWKLLLDLTTKN